MEAGTCNVTDLQILVVSGSEAERCRIEDTEDKGNYTLHPGTNPEWETLWKVYGKKPEKKIHHGMTVLEHKLTAKKFFEPRIFIDKSGTFFPTLAGKLEEWAHHGNSPEKTVPAQKAPVDVTPQKPQPVAELKT